MNLRFHYTLMEPDEIAKGIFKGISEYLYEMECILPLSEYFCS